VSIEVHCLPGLVDQTALAMLLLGLFLVLSCDLGIVFKNAPAFITSLHIFAVNTLAVLVAGDTRLKTLTILF
jgi:hypothetical protein